MLQNKKTFVLEMSFICVCVLMITAPTVQAATIYACPSGNGVWACSDGNQPDCSDVRNETTMQSYCAGSCQKIDVGQCGKAVQPPVTTSGQPPVTTSGQPPVTTPGNGSTTAIDCKINPDACLYNPLPTDSLLTMFLLILRGFLYMTGIVSVIFIVVGGFKMVVAQGNEESYESARKTVTWAIMGLVVAMLSFSIVAIVQYILGASLPLVGS